MEVHCQLINPKCKSKLQPGDMYYTQNKQLKVVLPNGLNYDLNNKDIEGNPPDITISKEIYTKHTRVHKSWRGRLEKGILIN